MTAIPQNLTDQTDSSTTQSPAHQTDGSAAQSLAH